LKLWLYLVDSVEAPGTYASADDVAGPVPDKPHGQLHDFGPACLDNLTHKSELVDDSTALTSPISDFSSWIF
jgi:hypothetical protein